MKKVLFSVISATLLIGTANAGKNVVPAPVEPIPVPVAAVPLGLTLGLGLAYSHGECQCDPSVICADGRSCGKLHKNTSYGINLKADYMYNSYIGAEAKYVYAPYKGYDMKHYGLYFKPTLPAGDNLDIYALLGYGKTECQTSGDSYKGFAWGVGAEYTLNKKVSGKKDGFGVYVEYLRPLKKTGNKKITVDMVNAGISYSF